MLNKTAQKIRASFRHITRQSPCPHESYDSLGGGSYVRCSDCGATVDVEHLPGAKEASDLFLECEESILRFLDEVERMQPSSAQAMSPLVEMIAGMEKDALRYRKLVSSGMFSPATGSDEGWRLRTGGSPAEKADLDMAVDLMP